MKIKAVSTTDGKPFERELVAIDGTFTLPDLPVGANVEVTVMKDGYTPSTRVVGIELITNTFNVTLINTSVETPSPSPNAALGSPPADTPLSSSASSSASPS